MVKEYETKWLKELARDFLALGSIPFFILVLVRIWILKQPVYFSQFIFAGIIFFLLMIFLKSNLYSGLGLVMLIFTSLHYADIKFTILAILVYIGLLVSLIYLGKDKKEIIKGILFGIVSVVISYYVVGNFLGI